jgi:two-component system, OmpR family, response regulator
MRGATVFVLEDDLRLSDVLVRGLTAEGFSARGFATAHQLLERLPDKLPDLFVIDVGLPDADGRDVCQALRAQGVKTPVLFLTGRDALTDRLAGFGAGGDDYVTKPFDLAEVIARLQALIRRSPDAGAIERNGLRIDPIDRTATHDGAAVELTPTELRVLATLAAAEGKVCARLELVRAAWPYGAIVHDNTLDVYVARVRRKLSTLPRAPTIVTVHGTGYRLQ